MEPPCVLVVDDEESIRSFLCRYLERKGCRIVQAGSGEAAIEVVQFESPAVAMLDIILPGMNGLKLAKHIKEKRPACQVLMMTSHSSVDSAVEAIRQGAFDYLGKPFDSLENVWSTVQRALAAGEKESRELAQLRRAEQLSLELCATVEGLNDKRKA